jgi:Dolichyl-phosphate-mannose-protein mannosyltransferase
METKPMDIRFLQKLDNFAEVLTDQLEKRKLLLLCGFSILYLVVTCLIASRKPMWNDEFFTYYLAVLPHLSDLWSALLSGGELIPPLVHLITRASVALLGVNHISIRLPEVLGFWVMSLCLFQFVSKRSSALYGFVAMLLPLFTGAYDYATEARPYALVLGFSGLSLLCWQAAAEGHARIRALIGLAASLVAAVSSHYYAVLLFVPLAIGEGVRSRSLRRLDLPIWLALGSAMVPLLLHLPLITTIYNKAATFQTYPAFWARPSWGAIQSFYSQLLAPAILPLVAVLMLSALYSIPDPSTPRRRTQGSRPPLPLHEMAAAFGFTAIPVAAVLLAKLVTGVFTDRYALPAVIGFGIVLAVAAAGIQAGRALIGVALILFLSASFMVRGIRVYRSEATISAGQAHIHEFLRSAREHDLPIVVSDPHTFMPLAYYAPPELAARLVYLADPGLSLRYLGDNIADQGMLELKPWFPVKIEQYGPYVASQRRFLVYGDLGGLNWLLNELIAADMRIELRGRMERKVLFFVSPNE